MSPSHSGKGKDSGTARVLGSGASGKVPPVTVWTRTVSPSACRGCRALGIPPSGHSCQAANEQQGKGKLHSTSLLSVPQFILLHPGLILSTQQHHLS